MCYIIIELTYFEGTDVSKTNESKECDICQY